MKPGDHPEFFRMAPPPGASRESTIRLDAEGRFFHRGDEEAEGEVENPKLARALHTWIARHPDDEKFILTNGYDWTYFQVDDAPFHVDAVHFDGAKPTLVLRNGERYPLTADTPLREGPNGALYATVTRKDGPFEARFQRSAQTELAPCLETEEGSERVGLRLGDRLVFPTSPAPTK
jgi:uncharacterized protein